MAETATETTALLAEHSENVESPQLEFGADAGGSGNEAVIIPYCPSFPRASKFLTTLIFTTSVLTLVLVILDYILIKVGPFGYTWSSETWIQALGGSLFLVLIVAIINLFSAVPLGLNLPVDLFLTLYTLIPAVALGSEGWPEGYGWCDEGRQPIAANCEEWKLAVKILIGICVGGGVIVGSANLILFVLRCISAFRTRFWTRPFPWRFPVGQITLEFTIKVLRQEGQQGPQS